MHYLSITTLIVNKTNKHKQENRVNPGGLSFQEDPQVTLVAGQLQQLTLVVGQLQQLTLAVGQLQQLTLVVGQQLTLVMGQLHLQQISRTLGVGQLQQRGQLQQMDRA